MVDGVRWTPVTGDLLLASSELLQVFRPRAIQQDLDVGAKQGSLKAAGKRHFTAMQL